MHYSQWLKGGPFLEISFLLELKADKKQTIQDIINKLSNTTNRIEIVDRNIHQWIDSFIKGYPYEEKNSQSQSLHELGLRLYIYFSRKRKATLHIRMISSNALIVNFWFYGSKWDEPEWDQIGIKKEEYAELTSFLLDLYSLYEFKVGGIATEQDVLELFGVDETYPNECYRYENLSPHYFMENPSTFSHIIWRETYRKLTAIPYHCTKLPKDGVLLVTGSSVD